MRCDPAKKEELTTMRSRLGKISVIAAVVCLVGAAETDAQTQSPERLSGSRIEAGTFFGVMIAGKDIARGVNATGGEQLNTGLRRSRRALKRPAMTGCDRRFSDAHSGNRHGRRELRRTVIFEACAAAAPKV